MTDYDTTYYLTLNVFDNPHLVLMNFLPNKIELELLTKLLKIESKCIALSNDLELNNLNDL